VKEMRNATHSRYERAARAAFEYAYPRGYGAKLNANWQALLRLADSEVEARCRFPTIRPDQARKVLKLYRGIAKAAIEA